jgi:hypothetical protein
MFHAVYRPIQITADPSLTINPLEKIIIQTNLTTVTSPKQEVLVRLVVNELAHKLHPSHLQIPVPLQADLAVITQSNHIKISGERLHIDKSITSSIVCYVQEWVD